MASLEAKGEHGWTALILLARFGRAELVKALVALGADINAKSDNGSTALTYAAYNGKREVFKRGKNSFN